MVWHGWVWWVFHSAFCSQSELGQSSFPVIHKIDKNANFVYYGKTGMHTPYWIRDVCTADTDRTSCTYPTVTTFDGEPRVICEGGKTVGLNELVQMAAKVLTQAQAQEVINTHHAQTQPTKRRSNDETRKAAANAGTPIMDTSGVKREILSPRTGGDRSQQKAARNHGESPWRQRGSRTVMENSRVKVEMMETCGGMDGFTVPAALAAEDMQ